MLLFLQEKNWGPQGWFFLTQGGLSCILSTHPLVACERNIHDYISYVKWSWQQLFGWWFFRMLILGFLMNTTVVLPNGFREHMHDNPNFWTVKSHHSKIFPLNPTIEVKIHKPAFQTWPCPIRTSCLARSAIPKSTAWSVNHHFPHFLLAIWRYTSGIHWWFSSCSKFKWWKSSFSPMGFPHFETHLFWFSHVRSPGPATHGILQTWREMVMPNGEGSHDLLRVGHDHIT